MEVIDLHSKEAAGNVTRKNVLGWEKRADKQKVERGRGRPPVEVAAELRSDDHFTSPTGRREYFPFLGIG